MIAFSEAQLLGWMSSFLFPLFRILALFTAAPVLSSRAVPVRVRVVAALALAVLVAPFAPRPPDLTIASPGVWGAIAHEIVVGLVIGFSARVLLAAFELAGEIIGLQMGLSFAGFFDPQGNMGNPVGSFLSTSALLAFVALNGPLVMIVATLQSLEAFPLTESPLAGLARMDPTVLFVDMFTIAMSMALPFIILFVFINLTLGIASRVAPQLNVFAVGFPVTIGSGLLLLALGFPLFERPLAAIMERLIALYGL